MSTCSPNPEPEVLFYFPVFTPVCKGLRIVATVFAYSFRDVVELLKDLFDWATCSSTVHHRIHEAAQKAKIVNES